MELFGQPVRNRKIAAVAMEEPIGKVTTSGTEVIAWVGKQENTARSKVVAGH
jgi:hypothetical protein